MRIQGADARGFLQGQLSNDLRLLTPAASLLTSYNSPQGRVIALPRLIERDQETFAIMPRELIDKVIERLRKYVLRAKVVLKDVSDEFFVLGLIDLDASAAASLGIAHALTSGAHGLRCPRSVNDYPHNCPMMRHGAAPRSPRESLRSIPRRASCSWRRCSIWISSTRSVSRRVATPGRKSSRARSISVGSNAACWPSDCHPVSMRDAVSP